MLLSRADHVCVPVPQQQRLFTPRERLRAQGVSDLVQLRWKPLSNEELIKEYEFVCTGD
jgi:hypothetical protein